MILTIFKNKNFLMLWSGQMFSQFADRMLVGVLLLNIHYLSQSNLAKSIPMFSFGLSAIIFGAVAGVFIDRYSKKAILYLTNFFRALLVLLFAIAPFFRESLILIFINSFFIFALAQFCNPAEIATLPSIVKKKELLSANSFFMSTWMAVTVLGFGFISFFAIFTDQWYYLYYIATAFYLIATILMFLLKYQEKITRKRNHIMDVIQDYKFGFYYTIERRIIRYALIKIFIASSVLAILSQLSIEFVQKALNQGSESFGFFVAFAGVGMGFGILTINIIKKDLLRFFPFIGFIISSTMLILLATINLNLYLALLFIFLLGVGNGYVVVPIQTMLQEKIPRTLRGRVFSLQNFIISMAFSIPVIFAGYLADIYSVNFVFLATGITILFAIAIIEVLNLKATIKNKDLE